MKYKTRGNASPQGKPRVYFTGHPQDCARYFGPLSDLILQTQNCAVFYDPAPEHPEDAENFLSDLDTMQLIVLVVTSRYVYQNTFAHDTVFAHAMARHIPVLPVLEESGIEADFNKKCGDIQFLDATARDDTQHPFEAKLKKYLDAVLVGDQLAQQVRDAFDAYIFLSYRKKDRRFAQQLMRLIHENDFCRDIAIWYDEFLVPGENFNTAIRQALEKSKLFALAITPGLLETPNYVMTEEYPKAKTAGKDILPVQMTETDENVLRSCYDGLPPLIDAGNTPQLRAALRDALAGAADPDRNSAPKHLYFIGLAYLGGIDVEVDYPRAVELISRAAEADLPEAIEKLVSMYNTGEGVARDYDTAVEWQRRLVAVRQKKYADWPNTVTALAWLNAWGDLGDALYALRRLPEADKAFRTMLEICNSLPADGSMARLKRYIGISYNKLGNICRAQGDLPGARAWYEKELAISELLAQQTGTVEARRDLSVSYNKLGDICSDEGNLPAARAWYEKCLAVSELLAKETGSAEARRDVCVGYTKLGDICSEEGDLPAARAWYEKDLAIAGPLAQETGTAQARRDLSISYERLGDLCKDEGDLPAARDWYEKELAIAEPLARETDTVDARRSLSFSYERLGDLCKDEGDLPAARAWYEKGLAIVEPLAQETGTAQARRDLSVSYERLGDLCSDSGDLPAARDWYEKELAIRKSLARETGTVEARRGVSVCCERLGDLCRTEGDLPAAKAWYKRCLVLRESLAQKTGTVDARRSLSVSYERLGNICSDEGDLPAARDWYEKGLAIAEPLAQETGTVNARRCLSTSYTSLGDICSSEGDLPAARAWYEKCLAIRESLARETGTIEARHDLSVCYERLGNTCSEAGDLPAARAWYEKGLAVAEQLHQQSDRADIRDLLGVTCYHLACCARTFHEELNYLKRSKAIWLELCEQCPEVPRYANNLAIVRRTLSEK